MKQTKQQAMQQLYDKLRAVSEINIIETPNIHSKGFYLSDKGNQNIYIKQSLSIKEKLKVLLHEYSHYIHLTHYYNEESRAECEIIANGSAFFICSELNLNISKETDLSKFTNDNKDTVNHLKAQIQAVSKHVLKQILLLR